MSTVDRSEPRDQVVLRFLAAPFDVDHTGAVARGTLLEWIDKAAYACAVAWSRRYCVTAYVGDIRFERPVAVGDLVEVTGTMALTGRTSMHVAVTVRTGDPRTGQLTDATSCLTVFVAVDDAGQPTAVPAWEPGTAEQHRLAERVRRRITVRRQIADAMSEQTYTDAGTAPRHVARFLAAPTDVNWGGKVHGGTVMRWIDEAAYTCAAGWSHDHAVATYAGGVRFYHPILIGSLVEVDARLLLTDGPAMHVSVHVRSRDPRHQESTLTTHCLMTMAGSGDVPPWEPATDEDHALAAHVRRVLELREATSR